MSRRVLASTLARVLGYPNPADLRAELLGAWRGQFEPGDLVVRGSDVLLGETAVSLVLLRTGRPMGVRLRRALADGDKGEAGRLLQELHGRLAAERAARPALRLVGTGVRS